MFEDKTNSYESYRKLKNSGNAHTWQQLISQKKFNELNFEKIHGRALNKMVSSKFLTNQGLKEVYTNWVDSKVKKGENIKFTGFPHELFPIGYVDNHVKDTINLQFKELVEKNKETIASKLIVVLDSSGSMTSPALGTKYTSFHIAKAMALFFNEYLSGTFSNSYMVFSDTCRFNKFQGSTPVDKFNNIQADYGSTNFQSVIDTFIKLKSNGVPEEDFPEGILCISDGEFNPSELNKTNVETARKRLLMEGRFSKEYVDNFKIVLWNIPNSFYCSGGSTKTETFESKEENTFYISGYSPSIISFLMTGKITNARELFDSSMNQEILNLVQI